MPPESVSIATSALPVPRVNSSSFWVVQRLAFGLRYAGVRMGPGQAGQERVAIEGQWGGRADDGVQLVPDIFEQRHEFWSLIRAASPG